MASPVVAMNVVDDSLKATDAGFIGSLTEPLQTIGRHAIPAPDDSDSTQSLADLASSAASRADRLEIELRGKLIGLLVTRESMDTLLEFYKSSLDVCIHLVHFCELGKDERYSDMAVRKLPLLLLEDILDGLSLRDCKYFWEHAVETQFDTLFFSNLFWKKSTVCHLPFLKVCNKFLRLLEMGPAPEEWTGRVLWTLSRGFGIADKSATKVWGSFHTANVTAFDAPQEFHGGNDKNQDYSLYQAFWSLQKEFSNPNTIQVADFLKKMRIVLAALESTHKESSKHTTSQDSSSTPPPPPPPCPTTPKYLTTSSLLPLQLSTLDFRIHVLTQFLIVASHLSSESPPLANALNSLQLRAKQLLRMDQPEHLQILESILQREQHWRAWKKTKCKASAFAPPYGGGGKDQESPNKKKRRMLLDGPLGKNNDEDQDRQQGHDFTLMDSDELATISKSMVEAVPTLDQHLEPYVDALDPDAGIEAEYHPKNDPIFSWRAMRLYTKHQLPLLPMCSKSGDFERMTRKYYQDKGREIPGIMPKASDEGSVSSEESKAEEVDPKVEENEPKAEEKEHHSKADEGGEKEDIEMEPVEKYKEVDAADEPGTDGGEEDGDGKEPVEKHETVKEKPVKADKEDPESQESVEEEEEGAQPMEVEEEVQTQNIKEVDSNKSAEPLVDSSNVKQDDGEVEEVVSDSVSPATSDEEKEEEMKETVKEKVKDQPKTKDSSRDRDRPPEKQEQQVSYRNSGPPPGGGGRHGGRNPHPRGRGGSPARGRSDEGRGGRELRDRGGRRPGRGGGGRGSDERGGRGGDDRGGRGSDDWGGRGGDDRGGRGGGDRGGRGDDRGGRGDSRRGPGPREDRNRGERRGGRDDNDDRRWSNRR